MGRARSLLFIVPFFAIAAVSFLAFSSLCQIVLPPGMDPVGPGEGKAWEWCYTIPKMKNTSISIGKNLIVVCSPNYIPFNPKIGDEDIWIPIAIYFKMKEFSEGTSGIEDALFYANAFRVLVGIKVLNVETGQYVPAEVLEKYYDGYRNIPIYFAKERGSSSQVTLTAGMSMCGVGLSISEQLSGDLGASVYDPIQNTKSLWTWNGFLMIGSWWTPHIGTVEVNLTWPWWMYYFFPPSGYVAAEFGIDIPIKPLPFMVQGGTARILIYILIEPEWSCDYVPPHPAPVRHATLRDGIGFILGDGITLRCNIIVRGKDSINTPFDFLDEFGGKDTHIISTPSS